MLDKGGSRKMATNASNENESGNADPPTEISPIPFIKVSLCQLLLAGAGIAILITYATVFSSGREILLLILRTNFFVFVVTGCCGLLLSAYFTHSIKWRENCALVYMLLNITSGAFSIVSIYFTITHGFDTEFSFSFDSNFEEIGCKMRKEHTVYASILLVLVLTEPFGCCIGGYQVVVLLRMNPTEEGQSPESTSHDEQQPVLKKPTT